MKLKADITYINSCKKEELITTFAKKNKFSHKKWWFQD